MSYRCLTRVRQRYVSDIGTHPPTAMSVLQNYVIDLLHEAGRSHCTTKLCDRYQFSAAMTFLSWFI
ncbi:hypothetical protein MTR_3g057050 [Medicago truncatula]|uniref:Uncharacterized protein n=1 Tax=Medicago truncatula TaxID=3880 RepID=G7J247_MEDTR|nr:hypothetical protein MTR_3g057050 [Medicago truncatula]